MIELRQLVFHIGLEKTGTSSLQAWLHHNEAALRRHSILYPRHSLAFGWENHKPLVGCYDIDDAGDKWLEIDPSRRAVVIASLVGEIEAAHEQTAIISAEHLSSRFREAQIRQLHADFERFDCRVMIVVRDHLSRLRSAYETYVTNGGALTLDEFAEGAMRPDAYDLRYADLIGGWERVFGRDRIELIAYGPDVIRTVVSRLASGLADAPGLDDLRLRASAGADVVAALRFANAVSAHPEPKRWANAAFLRDRQRRLQIKAWLQQSASGRPEGVLALDGARLARLTEMAARDAARLEADYGFILEPSAVPVVNCVNDEQAAELLARALCARAAQPWTKASLIGTGLAIAVALRDEVAALRRRRIRPL